MDEIDTGVAIASLFWFLVSLFGAAFLFLIYLLVLSIFEVFWKKFWGGHDE